MTDEILINVTPMETRVAVVEKGVLQDVYIERANSRGIVGNIYTGKVVRVLPGMQAGFVEFGVERTGFIHVSDISPPAANGKDSPASRSDDIRDYLHEGQKIVVQVSKDPLGSKGARLTTALTLSSRYLVLMPQTDHIGISARIEEAAERKRLQSMLREALVAEAMTTSGGVIIRTAAEGVAIDELRADLRYLKRLWEAVARRAKLADGPALVYEDLALLVRTVRDLARPGLERIRVDHQISFASLESFCADYVPELSPLLTQHVEDCPLFDSFGVESDIALALGRKIPLESGGYLVVDQTEAMTTIDVNTGSFVGRKNLQETIFKTNLEAAAMAARQLRVRNLGGIIIVDFIDMLEPEHRRVVHATLEKSMLRDPARNKILAISELGLVEMTRKRSRESLAHILCEECPVCSGRGALKSAETVCYEIIREIMRDAKAYENVKLMVVAAQGVVDRLLDEESAIVADLEELTGKTISFRVESSCTQEHFDILLL